jgi:UDP-N-acetylmuramoyl-L-alanyl-D-glutamate--2,6-diaminopimelate ligase
MRLYQQVKNIYHLFQAELWRALYGWPDRSLHLYGVTGTNGKTTTCYVLTSILAAQYGADKVGMLTTVAFRVGEKETINKTKMTTLDSRVFYRYMAQMRTAGVTHAVIELTSHALDQNRCHGIQLEGAIILNLAREHLDYHRTMAEYASAKQRMLGYLKSDALLIGKEDDEYVAKMLAVARQRGITVQGFTAAAAQDVHTPLTGEVNKENVLAASLLARAVGMAEEAITKGVAAVKAVPGRMEWAESPAGVRAVIDYAVTPDALDRLYQYVRSITKGKVYGVLGAAGRRDRGKRPDMARAAAQYADVLIITNEDPWDEPEEQIFNDLEAGLKDTKISWQRIKDRREALAWCVEQAQPGDVIVATGKGAERGMAFKDGIVPWNEREILTQLLTKK